MNKRCYKRNYLKWGGVAIATLCAWDGYGQQVVLSDLSSFRNPTANWQLAGSVVADPEVKYSLAKSAEGNGVLVNLPLPDPKQSKDVYSVFEHGDADIELEFMMAKESNSGIYLQGRYEVQLLDSWGKKVASAGDCGGIYERWDETRPDGQKGYQGYAPRQNASRVPGVWQKLRISFQAPRFDKSGKKIENARVLSIHLNGLLIHENVELTGPTRGGMGNNEVAKGPLRFQGDHGPVAFRNIVINPFETPAPVLSELKYRVLDGRVLTKDALGEAKQVQEGASSRIDYTVSSLTNDYVIRYTGKIRIPVKGNYRFSGAFWGGYGNLIIDGKEIFPFSSWHQSSREVELPAGDLTFDYLYSKVNEGDRPGFGLMVSGPGIRQTVLHEVGSVNAARVSNPILLEPARETALHRSFIDFEGKRLPYGLSVGTVGGTNYSVNLANGALLRVWKGDFLNVTPMWLDRGNGTSVPLGSAVNLKDSPQVVRVNNQPVQAYLLKGYKVDEDNYPTLLYTVNQVGFEDRIDVATSGKFIERTLSADVAGTKFSFEVASGAEIVRQPSGLYQIDGAYFVRMAEGSEGKVTLQDGLQVLSVEAEGKVSYQLIW
jgi:hypothetical protein